MGDGAPQSPAYVIQFGPKLSSEELGWVLKKLTKKKKDGGAELAVSCTPPTANQVFLIHHPI